MKKLLTPEEWLQRREKHQSRVCALLGPYLQQRGKGRPNPVIDFLFTYYNLRPGQLMRWHPGFGVTLIGPGSNEYANLRGYCRTEQGVRVDPDHVGRCRKTIEYAVLVLTATANRPANLSCFGLHEWAMVYRADSKQLRHSSVPLRLGHNDTDAVVESLPLRCTHFDAFRFFTGPARPRNATELTRDAQVAAEQPACLHAGMDLYKFAAKLLPLVDSDLLMDAFELAFAARELDMRASPYDLRAFGYDAVRIETACGRAEYVRQQIALSERSAVVRASLLGRCQELLRDADGVPSAWRKDLSSEEHIQQR
jgi:hypothetical protein